MDIIATHRMKCEGVLFKHSIIAFFEELFGLIF